jgi:hypothetical protein
VPGQGKLLRRFIVRHPKTLHRLQQLSLNGGVRGEEEVGTRFFFVCTAFNYELVMILRRGKCSHALLHGRILGAIGTTRRKAEFVRMATQRVKDEK